MDFTTVTETWGLAASPEQVAMAYARYKLAGDLADGKRVLEVGCGSGMGLAYLQQRASQVVGGDRTLTLLQAARDRLDSLALVCLDAHELPFSSSSFDVVLMLEMVYYLSQPERAFAECRRVLRPGGKLLVCLPNRNRPGFNRSPLSVHYPDVPELVGWFESCGFRVRVYAGFHGFNASKRAAAVTLLRRLAVRWRLIPKSMMGKAILKRLIYRRMAILGEIRDGMAPLEKLVELDRADPAAAGYKNLYAIGSLPPILT